MIHNYPLNIGGGHERPEDIKTMLTAALATNHAT